MSVDELLRTFRHPEWLLLDPLGPVLRSYVERLVSQRYDPRTIRHYLSGVSHFNYWAAGDRISVSNIEEASIKKFMEVHLAVCACPVPRVRGPREIRAGMRLMVKFLEEKGLVRPKSAAVSPIGVELQRFRHFLADSRGLARSSCLYEVKWVRQFLQAHFDKGAIVLSRLSPLALDEWIIRFAARYRPGTVQQIRTSLRSYFRFRAMRGDNTTALSAALPTVSYRGTRLIKTLSDHQLRSVLKSFDLHDVSGLRDYAMAHCLSDLGLRAQEVTQLCLDDIDWRAGTITVRKTKALHVRVLPLPDATGRAIAQYLRSGRPKCSTRRLFVRHVAPVEKPLGSFVVPKAMDRAFARCGLAGQFSGTHVLRRTLATRLQRRGTSLKAIADVLGHRELQTTTRYAKVDFERLRRLALPWVRREP